MAEPSGWSGPGRALSGDEVSQLAGQIADVTAAGLPLASGLRALGEELPSGRLRRLLGRVAASLESGLPLDAAFAEQRGRLPAHLEGLVLAGARTGKIGDVLGRLSGYTNAGVELRRSLQLRLVYPIFSIAFAVAVFVFVCVVLMSGFTKLFQDFGVEVPLLTQWALAVARAVAQVWWPLVQGLAALLACWLLLGLVLRRDLRSGLYSSLPLVGPVWRLTALAEFCHLLALLLESEVPLVEALPLAGRGIENGAIASASRTVARDVAAGEPLGDAVARRSLFPVGFARILGWAEEHRGLPEALHMAGEMFVARARGQADFVAALCGAVALFTIVGGVVTTILAVLVPIIGVMRRLVG